MATEKNNINMPTRKRKRAAQGTEQQQADAPVLSPIGVELAQNADDVATADGAKADRGWDPHMGARDDTSKRDNVPALADDDAAFNDYVSTLPDNQRDSKNFNVRRYWELNGRPANFDEAVNRGMFTMNDDDKMWHAGTVAYNKDADEYEFMKSPDHPTVGMEVAAYNSDDPEMVEFRKDYYLDQSSTPWKYKRRQNAPVVQSHANNANVPQRIDGTYNDEASDRSGAADAASVPDQGVEKVDAKISENLGTISQGGDVAENKKPVVSTSNDAKLRERYDAIQRENAALQQKKVDLSGISSIVKADSASAGQLAGAVDAIDAKVADNEGGIAQMFADDAHEKSEQKKQADAFTQQKEQAEAMQAVKDIDWSDDAQVSGLDKDTVRVAMADAFPDSRADLFNRPIVSGKDLIDAGWNERTDENGNVVEAGIDPNSITTDNTVEYEMPDKKMVMFTTIADGNQQSDGEPYVLTPQEMDDYFDVYKETGEDPLNLVISTDSQEGDANKLHKMQEVFYKKDKPVRINGERVNEEPQEESSQDSEEKGTTEEKGGDGDAENDMSFWLKPSSGSVPNRTESVPNDTTTSEADADTEKPKAAVEPEEPYLDLKSADEYGISEDNGEDVEDEVEGGTIRYKDYSKADKEAYDRLNEDERKNYDAIKSKITEYDAAIKAARDDNNLPEVLEYNRLKAEYEAELAEYKDPDKLKKRRARRTIAMFADVLSAIANMWGAYRGAKPIELKSATGAIGDAEAAEDKTLKERLKEYQKLADTARKEVNKEIARLDKADAATLAAYSKRLTRDYDKWRTAQEKEIENAKKKRDTSNQKSRDAQRREILAKNNQKRTQENIDYRAEVSTKTHAANKATDDKYKQKAEVRANAEWNRREEVRQKNKNKEEE